MDRSNADPPALPCPDVSGLQGFKFRFPPFQAAGGAKADNPSGFRIRPALQDQGPDHCSPPHVQRARAGNKA